jgi:hypothetical protein
MFQTKSSMPENRSFRYGPTFSVKCLLNRYFRLKVYDWELSNMELSNIMREYNRSSVYILNNEVRLIL